MNNYIENQQKCRKQYQFITLNWHFVDYPTKPIQNINCFEVPDNIDQDTLYHRPQVKLNEFKKLILNIKIKKMFESVDKSIMFLSGMIKLYKE